MGREDVGAIVLSKPFQKGDVGEPSGRPESQRRDEYLSPTCPTRSHDEGPNRLWWTETVPETLYVRPSPLL